MKKQITLRAIVGSLYSEKKLLDVLDLFETKKLTNDHTETS